jgi:hypothetical protein
LHIGCELSQRSAKQRAEVGRRNRYQLADVYVRGGLEHSGRVLLTGKITARNDPAHAVGDQIHLWGASGGDQLAQSLPKLFDGLAAALRAGAQKEDGNPFGPQPLVEIAKRSGSGCGVVANEMIAVNQHHGLALGGATQGKRE